MKSKVINAAHEGALVKLEKLLPDSKMKFEEMSFFKGSSWDDNRWKYLGVHSIRFATDERYSQELEKLNKIFLVDYLWQRRQKRRPLTPAWVDKLAQPLRLLASIGVSSLYQINHESYASALTTLEGKGGAAGDCGRLNSVIRFLFNKGLVNCEFDLSSPKDFLKTDRFGLPAISDKLPLPELVRSIIALKGAIDERWDGSSRAKIDKLAIYTQPFQYALGLRIGEVLRLPANCLFTKDGEMFCRVWTEKGSQPTARYVPTVWRELLLDAVNEINSISGPYRACAELIESKGLFEALDSRFEQRVNSIKENIRHAKGLLEVYCWQYKKYAARRMQLTCTLADDELVELKDIREYLPSAPASTDSATLLRAYNLQGLNIISKPLGVRKHKHYVSGAELKRMASEIVEFFGGVISEKDLPMILFGRAFTSAQTDRNYYLGLKKTKSLTRLESAAFLSIKHSRTGRNFSYFTRSDTERIIEEVLGGGYSYEYEIPLRDAELLFPEFLLSSTSARINESPECSILTGLDISSEPKRFYKLVNSDSALDVHANGFDGYLLDYRSLRAAIERFFYHQNSIAALDDPADSGCFGGVIVSSSSFSIEQKVSEYLFVAPASSGGVYIDSIPSILGYSTVWYSLKNSDNGVSAFTRYGVTSDLALIDSFQTHKGRHWQTNSLFRAGLAASIVNKWMGRTDLQGAHYDHRTARERASSVGDLMLREQKRFIGHLPEKIRSWADRKMSLEECQLHLDASLQTLHHSPTGYCARDINLKPCEFHLKCLTGNNGKGCREFILDLEDPVQRAKIAAVRDQAESELARLFEYLNSPNVPVESVEMHIEHQMVVFRNASAVLEKSELILTDEQAHHHNDYLPFRAEGSRPDDCIFQCGDVG